MKVKGGTSLWIGGGLVALAICVAITAPLIALTDPVMDANLMNAEIPPGLDFPFGTDAQGRDIYSRIVYGARISLTVGVARSGAEQPRSGSRPGLTAGYWGGWWDDLVTGLTNPMLSIPSPGSSRSPTRQSRAQACSAWSWPWGSPPGQYIRAGPRARRSCR